MPNKESPLAMEQRLPEVGRMTTKVIVDGVLEFPWVLCLLIGPIFCPDFIGNKPIKMN